MAGQHRNIIRFISEPVDESFQLFLRGHLYLEAILSEIIDRSLAVPDAVNELASMFYRKVKLVRALGKVSPEVEELLLKINEIRNKMAHKLDFTLTFDVAFALVTKASQAGIDFSDERIHQDRAVSEQDYGIYGVINEVICNTFSHLILQNDNIFTEEELGDFLG